MLIYNYTERYIYMKKTLALALLCLGSFAANASQNEAIGSGGQINFIGSIVEIPDNSEVEGVKQQGLELARTFELDSPKSDMEIQKIKKQYRAWLDDVDITPLNDKAKIMVISYK